MLVVDTYGDIISDGTYPDFAATLIRAAIWIIVEKINYNFKKEDEKMGKKLLGFTKKDYQECKKRFTMNL